MSSHERMRSLIRHVYSAAADESRWPITLECLADEYRGGVAGFQYRVGTEAQVRSARFVRLDPALRDAICTHFSTRNPWVRLTQPLLRSGDVVGLDHLLPLSQLRRTEFHDGILRPAGVVHAFGACVFRRGDDVLTFTVVRSPTRGPYEVAELRRVREILPHLRRAVQVNERLSRLQRASASLADGLDCLRHGVVVVNGRGHVVFANRAARATVAQRDGLTIVEDGLVASAYADRLKLRLLLDDAVRTAAGNGFGSGGAMTVSRRSLKRAFLVLVAPLPLALDGDNPSGLATVFISDPEARPETVDEMTRRLYGFTQSEARVANAFAASGNLEHVAEELRISRETVRWHLKRLYRKTDTNRQAALLMRLVDGRSQLTLDVAPKRNTESLDR